MHFARLITFWIRIMSRFIRSSNYDYLEGSWVLGPESGGTGGKTQKEAVKGLGGIDTADVGAAGGPVPLAGQYIPEANMPTAATGIPTVSGPPVIDNNDTVSYQITNYDSNLSYTVSTTIGTVSISGDTITYSPGEYVGVGGFTVNGRAILITIGASTVTAPTVTTPTSGASNLGPVVSVQLTSPTMSHGVLTNPRWTIQVSTAADFSSGVQTKTQASASDTAGYFAVNPATTYYVRGMWSGTIGANGPAVQSTYGASSTFSTKSEYLASVEVNQTMAADSVAYDDFSFDVSITRDGAYAAISARGLSGMIGGCYVYKRNGNSWIFLQKLMPAGANYGQQGGHSVAMSDNGYIILGTPCYAQVGIVYTFVTSDMVTWTQSTTITKVAEGATNEWFGYTVSLNATGDVVVIGAPQYNNYSGRAYVYTRSGTTWTQAAVLSPPVSYPPGSWFGKTVAINKDGTIVAVSSWYANSGRGGQCVYEKSGTTYTLTELNSGLTVPGSSRVGDWCAVTNDGDYVAFTGCVNGGPDTRWEIFKKTAGSWSLFANGVITDLSVDEGGGRGIALGYGAGTVYLYVSVVNDSYEGVVHAYSIDVATGLSVEVKLKPHDAGNGCHFGSNISCSKDASVLIVDGWRYSGEKGCFYTFL
jgi:hypothetical protein